MASPKQVWVSDTPDAKEFDTKAEAEAYETAQTVYDQIDQFLKDTERFSNTRKFSEYRAVLRDYEEWRANQAAGPSQ